MLTSLPIVHVDRYYAKNLRFHAVQLPGEREPKVYKHLDELVAFLTNQDINEFVIQTQFHTLIVSNVTKHAPTHPELRPQPAAPTLAHAPKESA